MKKTLPALFTVIAMTLLSFTSFSQISPAATKTIGSEMLIGRWDITVDEGVTNTPAWLEVELSGIKTLVGRFVGAGGSARPITQVFFEGGNFHFSIPPQWESGNQNMSVEGRVDSSGMRGTLHTVEGKDYSFTGGKAPYLTRSFPVAWGTPIRLFNGKTLAGWKASGNNQWVVENGVLSSPRSGSNLVSERTFTDFKLHVEFRYPKGSNSGVYLRGRYETQIEDNPRTDHPSSHLFGGIYGFLSPNQMAILEPGQWQSFDITLIGRIVTVVANGKTIICSQEIPGITGGALDSNEGEPGPIYFQGDHGPIEFRNIIITPAK